MSSIDKVRVNNTDYDIVSGDNLPVGTEVDIDDNATIPTGWEEVDDGLVELASFSASTSSQTVTLSQPYTDFKRLIFLVNNYEQATFYVDNINITDTSKPTGMQVSIAYGTGSDNYTMTCTVVNNTTLNITCNRSWGTPKIFGLKSY